MTNIPQSICVQRTNWGRRRKSDNMYWGEHVIYASGILTWRTWTVSESGFNGDTKMTLIVGRFFSYAYVGHQSARLARWPPLTWPHPQGWGDDLTKYHILLYTRYVLVCSYLPVYITSADTNFTTLHHLPDSPMSSTHMYAVIMQTTNC